MTVAIIGSGNVATVLGKLIQKKGHRIVQVVSRKVEHAAVLAKELHTRHASHLNDLLTADIYIIAVPDAVIPKIAAEMHAPGKIVVHTSGSVSMDVLCDVTEYYGVLYPLQSLRRESNRVPAIPLLVNAVNHHTIEDLSSFALTLSPTVHFADEQQRLNLHTAAVIVSNFTNYLYALAKKFCEDEATDFSLLYPLIEEVAGRLRENDPATMQTGPAVRGDISTIEKHLSLLSAYPELKKIYQVLSESILKNLRS